MLLIVGAPLGCPLAEAPEPNTLPERGVLETTATGPASAGVGETVELIATANGAEPLYYAWAQIAGPGVSLRDAATARARFVAPSLPEERALRFVVTTSNATAVGQAEVEVTISADPNYGQTEGPSRPTADAGADQRVKPGTEVTLSGSGSTGTGLEYRWRQVSGTDAQLSDPNQVSVTFTAPAFTGSENDTLVFELAVTDSAAQTVTDRVQVTLLDPTLSDTQVLVETTLGDFVIELYPDDAPITVANFLQYVDDEFYDNTLIHRVVPDFVIQGGGFEPGLVQKETRDPIKNEADNGLSNERGTVAMARTNDPDSATSQWFVNLKNNVAGGDGQGDLDPGGVSPEGYAVFGRVVQGMDVVDAIGAVETETRDGMQDVPVEDVVVESIRRVKIADEVDSE